MVIRQEPEARRLFEFFLSDFEQGVYLSLIEGYFGVGSEMLGDDLSF